MKSKNYDVCFLQETHLSSTENAKLWKQQWGGEFFYSSGATNARGVCILINPKVKLDCSEIYQDAEGRAIGIKIVVCEKTYLLYNIYGPNTDDPSFIQKIIASIEAEGNHDYTIIGGDFNFVMDPQIDRKNSTYNHYNSCEVLTEFMDQCSMCDVWRVQNPLVPKYTWCRDNTEGRLSASRIDMFIISESLNDLVSGCKITYGHRSDHSTIELKIQINEYKRGPGIWRLNTQVLNEADYQEGIRQCIKQCVNRYTICQPDDIWREIKIKCAIFSKKYCKTKTRERKKLFSNLQKLEQSLVEDILETNNEEAKDSLKQVRGQIAIHDRIRTESSIFRSRAQFAKSGEKCSKFFFGLEKRKYLTKNSQCVIDDAGRKITDPEGVLNEQFKFYKRLYEKDSYVSFNLKRDSEEPCLSNELKHDLEKEISEAEIYDAIMTLKNGKVCGSDGLPVEFYRTFYNELKQPLLRMYLYAYKNGVFPKSTKRGVVSLLPKRGKDARYIKHRRPLTLLNYDFKILSKLIDNRIRTVLPNIISEDQTGFLAGRHITTNIRKTLDVVEFCNKDKKAAVILTIDMNKCFD